MKKLLITTPTLTSGSWNCIENLLPYLENNFKINIVGLGGGRSYKDIPITKIPYFSFERLNPKIGSNVYYNILYQLPIQVVSLYKFIILNPKAVLSNGFTPLILILPIAKLLNRKIIIYYGSHLGFWLDKPVVLFFAKLVGLMVDHIFVNSKDSYDDVIKFMGASKISIIDHVTDFEAFSDEKRVMLRKKYNIDKSDFVILFANRMVPSKNFPLLIEVVKKAKSIDNLKMYFAGEGTMYDELQEVMKINNNIKYFGPFGIKDKEILKEWITVSNLVWTNAETTYISLSGVESLAMGTPILIADQIWNREEVVPISLIPNSIGWVVKSDAGVILETIKSIEKSGITERMRTDCVSYAKDKFGTQNLKNAVEILMHLTK